jgi:hypothetical protein
LGEPLVSDQCSITHIFPKDPCLSSLELERLLPERLLLDVW